MNDFLNALKRKAETTKANQWKAPVRKSEGQRLRDSGAMVIGYSPMTAHGVTIPSIMDTDTSPGTVRHTPFIASRLIDPISRVEIMLSRNRLHVYFDSKPNANTRGSLKRQNWEWDERLLCWHHTDTEGNRDYLRQVFGVDIEAKEVVTPPVARVSQAAAEWLDSNGKLREAGLMVVNPVSLDPVTYQSHNDTNEIKIGGTSLLGKLDNVTFGDLVRLFGEPQRFDRNMDGGDGKIDAEWDVLIDGSKVVTIYNWKNGRNYCGPSAPAVETFRSWNVGGNDVADLDTLRGICTGLIPSTRIKGSPEVEPESREAMEPFERYKVQCAELIQELKLDSAADLALLAVDHFHKATFGRN